MIIKKLEGEYSWIVIEKDGDIYKDIYGVFDTVWDAQDFVNRNKTIVTSKKEESNVN